VTSANIQLKRATFYGKWLLLAFVLGLALASEIGPDARWLAFGGWAVLCGLAANQRHMLAWSALCLTPLAMLSLLWLGSIGSDDPFGIRWAIITFFTGGCLVTAVTGILSMLEAVPPLRRIALAVAPAATDS
jgi:hypothetical protein